ncbi:MAG: AraC family transcriptional regulator, partial [Pseudomonadota bacterium]
VAPPVEATEANEAAAAPHEKTQGKYARSALSEDYAKILGRRIEKAMREDALYLDANLSLQKLSRHVGAPPNLVSQTLNEEIGSTFFDYIAHWRIEAAKPRILSGDGSILAIALEAGFNSRSTFYKAFKRETGMTPKAFHETKGARDEKPGLVSMKTPRSHVRPGFQVSNGVED